MNIYKIEAVLETNEKDVEGELVFDGLERFKYDDFDVLIKVLMLTFSSTTNETKKSPVQIRILEKCNCCTDYMEILSFDTVETLCRVGQVFENIMSNHVKSSVLSSCLKLGADRTKFNKNLNEKFDNLFENKEFGIQFLEGEEK